MRRTLRISATALALGIGFTTALAAQRATPTRIMVRAVSNDAKIIGSNVGGALITIRDAGTGEILARGEQEGGTGDTRLIMTEPHVRGAALYDTEGAAGFLARLELEHPTVVDIVAEGPLGTPHATVRASKRLLLVPGRDVLGDGVVLVLNGFTVELLAATPGGDGSVPVRARVTMLCGCPTEPGGLWDADEIDVLARLIRDGAVVAEQPLSFAGETSVYHGTVRAPAGAYTLEVLALDPEMANFGRVTADIEIR